MTSTEANPTIDIPPAISVDTAAEVAGQLASIGVRYATHPNFIRAAHLAAVLSAVAHALPNDMPGAIDAEAGYNSLEHTCGHHLEMAIAYIAEQFQRDGMNAEDIVRAIPGTMLRMFE